jgi:hypothetical protein
MNEIVPQICTVTYAIHARLNYPNYGIRADFGSVVLCVADLFDQYLPLGVGERIVR